MIKVFQKIMDRRRQSNRVENDALQTFMDAKFNDGSSPSAAIVTGLMICLLFAGQHTSSVTASWTGLFMFDEVRRGNKKLLDELLAEQKAAGANLDYNTIR